MTQATEPVFEVRTHDGDTIGGHVFKIWADGRIEGFPPNVVILNRIPSLKAEAVRKYRDQEIS